MRVLCRRTNKEYTKYCLAYSLFQSTSSVWRTTLHRAGDFGGIWISIHVLRVEDDRREFDALSAKFISIHVLRAEDDTHWTRKDLSHPYFNPRPPCGGRPAAPGLLAYPVASISIHVLRAEDDRQRPKSNDTTPISIHVLRAEDDNGSWRSSSKPRDFNPRPPCGGRRPKGAGERGR